MKRISRALFLGAGLTLAWGCWAADAGKQTGVGEETRQWLELQRSGSAASQTGRPMSADTASRTYQRHVETHSYPVPKSFADEKQSFVQD